MKGDKYISSDVYPSESLESLELMKISDICIFFNSCCFDETLYSKIPCINFTFGKRIYNMKNNFINDDKIFNIKDFFKLEKENLKKCIDYMYKKDNEYFDILKENI